MLTCFLLILASLYGANCGVVRVPKIYNALISSDENLTPSHAYPVVEPVLRTTALGVAFPPIVVHPAPIADGKEAAAAEKKPQQQPELAYHGTLYPLAYDPYFPYASDLLFAPSLPYYQQPVYVDLGQQQAAEAKPAEKASPLAEPVKTAASANFKKNPEIPDVPPPPLPVKVTEKKRKE